MDFGSGLSILGGITDIFGGLVSSKAQERAYEFNALAASQNAEQATAEAYENERRTRVEGFKQVEDMKASYAASGIAAGGSAFDAIYNSVVNAELDALTVRSEGLARARGFRQEAALAQYGAKSTKTAGALRALGGAFNLGGKAAAMGAG